MSKGRENVVYGCIPLFNCLTFSLAFFYLVFLPFPFLSMFSLFYSVLPLAFFPTTPPTVYGYPFYTVCHYRIYNFCPSTIFGFLWASLQDCPLACRLSSHYLCTKCVDCTTLHFQTKLLVLFLNSFSFVSTQWIRFKLPHHLPLWHASSDLSPHLPLLGEMSSQQDIPPKEAQAGTSEQTPLSPHHQTTPFDYINLQPTSHVLVGYKQVVPQSFMQAPLHLCLFLFCLHAISAALSVVWFCCVHWFVLIFCGVKDVWAFGLIFSSFYPFLSWVLSRRKPLSPQLAGPMLLSLFFVVMGLLAINLIILLHCVCYGLCLAFTFHYPRGLTSWCSCYISPLTH